MDHQGTSSTLSGPLPLQKPPRLNGQKSKTGCKRCRARRVKQKCARHNVSCEYDRLPEFPPQGSGSRSSPEISTGASRGKGFNGGSYASRDPSGLCSLKSSATLVHWELRALHHFTVCTSRTLPGSHIPGVLECWSVRVPRLALEFEPLLHALLALTTLHLMDPAAENYPDQAEYRNTHLDVALSSYRQSLEQMDIKTANAACFTAMLLNIDAFAVLQDRQALHPYEAPLQWMRIVQGTQQVFEVALPLIRADPSSEIMTIISSYTKIEWEAGDGDSQRSSKPLSHLLQPDFLPQPPINELGEDGICGEDQEVFLQTIEYLQTVAKAFDDGEPPLALVRMLLVFPLRSPARLLDLVEARDFRALILLSHFFALFAPLRHVWWVGNTPEKEISNIRRQLPRHLHHFLAWPMQMLIAV